MSDDIAQTDSAEDLLGLQKFEGKTALIMAGGTGGHVFPALAVADILRKSAVDVQWLGTAAGIEARVIPQADIKLHCIDVKGVRGKGKLGLLKAPWLVLKAIWQARKVFKAVRPDVVMGMGGFASGPGAVAAKLCGVPLVIHEQNARAGMTNRLSLPMAKRKLAAFPGAFGDDHQKGIEIVGNPIRGDILNIEPCAQRYAKRSSSINLLIVGGSLGAAVINQVVPQALALLDEELRPKVWHQSGANKDRQTQQFYDEAGVTAEVVPFIDDMQSAYSWADLVICRAGALTVSELAIAGVASILVPHLYAVDDHQTANARYLADAGAALLLDQKSLDSQTLAGMISDINSRELLASMAEKALSAASPKASEIVANVCLEEIR